MSMHARRNFVIALVATITLIAAASVYSSHGFGYRSHKSARCELCVHFSGTAGLPAHAVVVRKPTLVVRMAPVPPTGILPGRRKVGSHLPRGPPPAIDLI